MRSQDFPAAALQCPRALLGVAAVRHLCRHSKTPGTDGRYLAPLLVPAMVLRATWCPEQDGFLCAYTGVKVNEWDLGSPWEFCIDHAVPGDEGTLVVASYWVNAVKTALTAD